MKIFGVLLCFIFCLAVWISTGVINIRHNANFISYLYQASHSNTLNMSEAALVKAINYADQHNWTRGSTALFIETPGNDIAVWRANMQGGLDEIRSARSEDTSLAASNTLMKLRESMWFPSNLAYYPNLGAWVILWTLSGIAVCVAFVLLMWTMYA